MTMDKKDIKQTLLDKEAIDRRIRNLGFTDELVVSQDFIGDHRTSIIDSKAGIFSIWYCQTGGYSQRQEDWKVMWVWLCRIRCRGGYGRCL